MRSMLYYPGFEVRDENWLKFALLYMKELYTIVPVSGDNHLSYMYRCIENDTDFFQRLRPEYEEGSNASLDALDHIEKIFRHPKRYNHIFGTFNVIEKWREEKYQDYLLFREKYTYEFEEFCIDNRIAYQGKEGMYIPKELAYLYMSILSNVISDTTGISAITDNVHMDNYCVFSRRTSHNAKKKISLAKNIINLHLPDRIQNIRVEDIIALRNSNDYNSILDAFHNHLDNYLDSLNNAETGSSFEFAESLNYSLKNISCEMVKLTPQIVTLAMGVWVAVHINTHSNLDYLLHGINFGAVSANLVQISNEWKNSKSNRFAKKYLANIKRLHHSNQDSNTLKFRKRRF